MDNPFWEYSLRVYALDGVAPSCLVLQEQFGLDVNLLLYAAWLSNTSRLLTVDHLTALDASVADWRNEVVKPLRALRQQLHSYLHAASAATELNIIDELKALELRTERQQQDMIYVYNRRSPSLPEADYPLLDNLTLVAQLASSVDDGWMPTINDLITLIPR